MHLAFDNTQPSAESLTGSSGADPRRDGVEALRRLLKIESERLRIRHRLGGGGSEVAAGRSDLVDVVVGRACEVAAADLPLTLPIDQDQIAVVALGGYGRRELAPFSDVDLLFLHAEGSDDEVATVAEGAVALLGEAGLTVSHAFRTVAECVALSLSSLYAATALSDARLVAGSPRLFARLVERLGAFVSGSSSATAAWLASLRRDLDDRYRRFGRAVGLLEPNVKESPGGLRDLHVVLWAAQALFGTRGVAGLHEHGALGDGQRKAALSAYDHLYRIRNEAHFITGRAADVLDLEMQPLLAENLGYRGRRGLLASEIFMRDYYERASILHGISRAFLLRYALAPLPAGLLPVAQRPRPRGTFEIRDGKLHSRGESMALGSARRLLQAFSIAQREGLELSEELKLDIRGSLRLVDRSFRESPGVGRAFVRLVAYKGGAGSTLRAMHEAGLLGRLVPEFGRVTFLVQHDFYHRYTVDEHTLAAIDALDQLATSAADPALSRLRQVLDEVAEPATVYLGLLLHDVGKGRGPGHVRRGARIAERVCARMGLEAGLSADVAFLVDAHLEMSRTSQRRDLDEPGLVESFARRVSTISRLNMLLLLTYADHCGVGPGVWSEWKGALLWDLYARTRAHLEGPSGWPEDAVPGQSERAAAKLKADFAPAAVDRHFALMPDRYARVTDAADMIRHFHLLERLGEGTLAADWHPAAHATDLVVAGRDHPGLFAQLAGTLTSEGLDILSADVYTRQDGVALDVFKVREAADGAPVPPARWSDIEASLRSAVEGRHDVAAAVERSRAVTRRRPHRRPLARPRVGFDAFASTSRSVIEVRAEDEPGLAFRIASVLSAEGLDIAFAKIATEKSHALDVFYVTGAGGRKLDAEESARVEAALLAALEPRRTQMS